MQNKDTAISYLAKTIPSDFIE